MWQVTKTVNISEFPTDILISELHNRLGDYLHDPEPKHEPHLEQQPEQNLHDLRKSLLRVLHR